MPIRCIIRTVRPNRARALVTALLFIGPVTSATAQEYPTRPVRLIVASWFGILAPARTPQEIIAKLNAALVNVIRERELLDKLAAEGAEPAPGRPEEFARLLSSELTTWGKVIKASGL